MSGCVQLLDEANTLSPTMFQLHAAGVAYLQGVHSGQGPAALRKSLASFRAEFLAVRADWQMQELARQEKDEGQTAAWHMRRVALAAQAWLRSSKTGSAQRVKQSRAKLEACQQDLLEFSRRSPKVMAGISGAEAFARATVELVALTQGKTDKRPEAALTACRRLLNAFNDLVVD